MYWQAGMPGMATSGNANVDVWVVNPKPAPRLCDGDIISDLCCPDMIPEHHEPKRYLHEQERKLASRASIASKASNLSKPAG